MNFFSYKIIHQTNEKFKHQKPTHQSTKCRHEIFPPFAFTSGLWLLVWRHKLKLLPLISCARRESLERSIFFCQENYKKFAWHEKKQGEILNLLFFFRWWFHFCPLPAATLNFLPISQPDAVGNDARFLRTSGSMCYVTMENRANNKLLTKRSFLLWKKFITVSFNCDDIF